MSGKPKSSKENSPNSRVGSTENPRGVPQVPESELLSYKGYTLKVGQEFIMHRVQRINGRQISYESNGRIKEFGENKKIVITERYSRSRGRMIDEVHLAKDFFDMIENNQITLISPNDPNEFTTVRELERKEAAARQKDQEEIKKILGSIYSSSINFIRNAGKKIRDAGEKINRRLKGLSDVDVLVYGRYTFKVGQKIEMPRRIRETGETYTSKGKIIGFMFRENDEAIVVIERYSYSAGGMIRQEYTAERFVRDIGKGEVILISPNDPNEFTTVRELERKEAEARQKDQEKIRNIADSIRNPGGAEAGVEKPRRVAVEIYDNTRGIEIYTTPKGETIAYYTSRYRKERQEDRAVVGATEIGGREVKLMCAIDGIGGSRHGDFAAQAFAESIKEAFEKFGNLPVENLPDSFGQGLGDERKQTQLMMWQERVFIEDNLILPAMQQAREKIRKKAQEDPSYTESSCVFTAAVIVGNRVYFYTVGDSIGAHFSLTNEQIEPFTTRVNSGHNKNGEEVVTAWVGLDESLENITPLAAQRLLNPGGVVVVSTDGITDNFREAGRRETIAKCMRDSVSGEKSPNIRGSLLRLKEKLSSLSDGERKVPPSEEIARRILRYVSSLGNNAKVDNQTFMVYYYPEPQTNRNK